MNERKICIEGKSPTYVSCAKWGLAYTGAPLGWAALAHRPRCGVEYEFSSQPRSEIHRRCTQEEEKKLIRFIAGTKMSNSTHCVCRPLVQPSRMCYLAYSGSSFVLHRKRSLNIRFFAFSSCNIPIFNNNRMVGKPFFSFTSCLVRSFLAYTTYLPTRDNPTSLSFLSFHLA